MCIADDASIHSLEYFYFPFRFFINDMRDGFFIDHFFLFYRHGLNLGEIWFVSLDFFINDDGVLDSWVFLKNGGLGGFFNFLFFHVRNGYEVQDSGNDSYEDQNSKDVIKLTYTTC